MSYQPTVLAHTWVPTGQQHGPHIWILELSTGQQHGFHTWV